MGDSDDLGEMKALVVGFLQQRLNDNPRGFTLQEFERVFPGATDEPRDWYKRYNKKSLSEALQAIGKDINLRHDHRYNATYVSLNLASEAVDPDLVDLIKNQKSSNKKRTRTNYARPSHRVLASRSFSLNRQGHSAHRSYHQPARLNHDQQYRGDQFIRRRSPPPTPQSSAVSRPPSIYDKPGHTPTKWVAANDPRQNRSSSMMVPPQIRIPSTQPQPQLSSALPNQQQQQQQTVTRISPTSSVVSRPPVAESMTPVKEPVKVDDPAVMAKKHHLRQRLVSLIARKSSEIKIFHLNSLYQLEFNESIEPEAYNHKSLATLLLDPIIQESIQIIHKTPFTTISIRPKVVQPTDKENVAQTNGHSAAKPPLDAVDPFNVRPMLQSLGALGQIKEPPLGNFEIDDIVKYKTVRMVFKSEMSTMKLDDWEIKFEQENRLRIRIRDYGCRTLLEFFKRLSVDIPINVQIVDEQWVATIDLARLSTWLKEMMEKNQFRALTAVDCRYELIAFPDDKYTYTNVQDILHPTYQPAHILSVKRADSMWIQLRTPKRIEEHLCVEASLSCYEDFKQQQLLPVPRPFIRPGFPCAVHDKNIGRWCRGLVLKVEKRGENHEADTLLVDYGLERTYATKLLVCLMKNHLRLPVGSIYSKLHGIRDDKTNSIKTQRHAKMILQEYTNPPVTLACKFLGPAQVPKNPSYLPSVSAEVILVDTRQGKDCNLADDINIPLDGNYNEDGSETPTESSTEFNFVNSL